MALAPRPHARGHVRHKFWIAAIAAFRGATGVAHVTRRDAREQRREFERAHLPRALVPAAHRATHDNEQRPEAGGAAQGSGVAAAVRSIAG